MVEFVIVVDDDVIGQDGFGDGIDLCIMLGWFVNQYNEWVCLSVCYVFDVGEVLDVGQIDQVYCYFWQEKVLDICY